MRRREPGLADGCRGNSGIILAQVLRGLAGTLRDSTVLGPASVAEALRAASGAAYQAVLQPVEGTILTVVRVSADGAADASASGADLAGVVRAARDAGREALDETPDLLPVLAAAGVVDAGGAGYLLLLGALLHVVANAAAGSWVGAARAAGSGHGGTALRGDVHLSPR